MKAVQTVPWPPARWPRGTPPPLQRRLLRSIAKASPSLWLLVGGPREHVLVLVRQDWSDQILLDQLLDSLARERAVHLQLLRDDRGRNQLQLGHVREHLVVRGLVEEHKVGELLLHLALATTTGGGTLLRRLLLVVLLRHFARASSTLSTSSVKRGPAIDVLQ